MKTALHLRRLLRGMLVAAALLGFATGADASLVKGPSAVVPAGAAALSVAVRDAVRLAERAGGEVVRVSGDSMLPYFGNDSLLVVRKEAFEGLRAGAVAVYRNNFGDVVAHRLETRVADGWLARGANNRAADSTVVTAENFVGTVYVTLHARSVEGSVIAGIDSLPVAYAMAAK